MADTLYKTTFYAAVLSTARHAEEVEYLPAGQTVGRTLTALVIVNNGEQPGDQTHKREIERAIVVVGKDESHAKGGVERPAHRDRILRDGDDRSGPLLGFSGRVIAESPHHWELEFVRSTTTALGRTANKP